MRSFFFYNGKLFGDEGLPEEIVHVALGYDNLKMIESELQNRVAKAVQNSLSENGETTLKEIITKNISIFKICLRSEGPARIEPMKIVLDPTKNPVKVKVRKYASYQGNFLDVKFSKLVDMGLLKTSPHAALQAAPHFVLEDYKSK